MGDGKTGERRAGRSRSEGPKVGAAVPVGEERKAARGGREAEGGGQLTQIVDEVHGTLVGLKLARKLYVGQHHRWKGVQIRARVVMDGRGGARRKVPDLPRMMFRT
jgi:hypothetical protein